MFDIDTENNGFVEGVGFSEKLRHLAGNGPGPFINDQVTVVILGVVEPVVHRIAVGIQLTFFRPPPFQINVETYAEHFVGGEKTIGNPLPKGVGVERFAEVFNIGDGLCFLRGGGETDMGGAFEVVQNLPPGAVSGCTATMAFVHHYQIKEIRAEFPISV